MNKFIIIGGVVILIIISGVFYSQRDTVGENNGQESSGDLTAITPLPTPLEEVEQTTKEDVTITPMQEEVTELIVEDLIVGTGAEAVSGKKITVNYRGTLTDGTEFDSSYSRNQPFTFTLGVGQVIQGWDQGVAGMKVGGKRMLTIPPKLGYGSRDTGTIPPNSVLIFEVELLEVE